MPAPCIFVDTLMLEYGREIIKLAAGFERLRGVDVLERAIGTGVTGGILGVIAGLSRGGPGGLAGGLAGLTLTQVLDVVFNLFDEITTFGETLDAYYTAIIRLELIMLVREGRLQPNPALTVVSARSRETLASIYTLGEPTPLIADFAQISVMNLMACAFITSDAEVRNKCGTPPEPIVGACFDVDAKDVRLKTQCRANAIMRLEPRR